MAEETDPQRHRSLWPLPRGVRHLLLGALGTLLLLLAFALLPELHAFDMRLAGWLQQGQPRPLSDQILLVDVPLGRDVPEFRNRLGKLLETLGSNPENLPRVVGLDISFESSIREGQSAVLQGIQALHQHHVPVCGALYEFQEGSTRLAPDDTRGQLMAIYEAMDSVGHNRFDKGVGGIFYAPRLDNQAGRIAMAYYLAGKESLCDQGVPATQYVHRGPPLEKHQPDRLLSFDPASPTAFRSFGGAPLTTPPDFRGKTLIVGRLGDDRPFGESEPSGPETVAWAVNDLLAPATGARTVLASPALHLGLAFLMPLVALGLLAAFLRYLRAWRLHPWRLAALAGGLSLAVPVLLVLSLAAAGRDYTQVLLPTCLTALALGLAAHHRSGADQEADLLRQSRLVHEHVSYDLFISYRRNQAPWVQDKLLPALLALRRADGTAYRVFWDNKDLHSDLFLRQLERAVYDSRIFLPLLTPDYFASAYCRWEMACAFNRIPTGAIRLVPMMHEGFDHTRHGHPDFPSLEGYHGYATEDPAFLERLTRDLLSAEALRP